MAVQLGLSAERESSKASLTGKATKPRRAQGNAINRIPKRWQGAKYRSFSQEGGQTTKTAYTAHFRH